MRVLGQGPGLDLALADVELQIELRLRVLRGGGGVSGGPVVLQEVVEAQPHRGERVRREALRGLAVARGVVSSGLGVEVGGTWARVSGGPAWRRWRRGGRRAAPAAGTGASPRAGCPHTSLAAAAPAPPPSGTRASARAAAACTATARPAGSGSSASAWRRAGPRRAGRGSGRRQPARGAAPCRRPSRPETPATRRVKGCRQGCREGQGLSRGWGGGVARARGGVARARGGSKGQGAVAKGKGW